MKKHKTGRNDLCPCNSGIKYKKCCLNKDQKLNNLRPLPPELLHVISQHEARMHQQRIQHGLGHNIVSTEMNGYRLVGVKDKLLYSSKWKTFHDFLFDHIKQVLGSEWGNAEIAKPLEERHPIMQWYNEFCLAQQNAPKNDQGIYSAEMNGSTAAYLRLAYHLFLIRHNVELEKRLIARLKTPDQFYGAYYELFVVANFIRAGFEIDLEDESDGSSKHCEFNATHRESGQKFSVEAKSRGDAKASTETENVKIERKLRSALGKDALHQRVVFIDINVPDTLRDADEVGYLKDALQQIRNKEDTMEIHNMPAPTAYVFFTNVPYHHHPKSKDFRIAALAEGFKIPEFKSSAQFSSVRAAYASKNKHIAMFKLMEGLANQDVPSTFDGNIPEFAFGHETAPRLLIGNKYLIPDRNGNEVEGILEDAIVMQNEKMVHGIYRLENGRGIHARCPISDIELSAYRKHPDTFFGVYRQKTQQIKDDLAMFEFLLNSYKNTPKERLLEFMSDAPDINYLKTLPQAELAEIYCERCT